MNWTGAVVRNHTTSAVQPFEPLTEADRPMLETGGLVPYLKRDTAASHL